MEHTCLRQNSTTDRNGAGSLLVAGDYSPHVFSQRDDEEIQTNGSKTKANAHALKQQRPVRYGLPCVNCKAYYASDLPACPICKCAKRVPATGTEAESTQTLNKPQGGVLQPALRSFINLDSPRACRGKMPPAGRRNGGASTFVVESKLLLCTNTDEVNAGTSSPDILAENRNTQDESVLVCLSYDQLREELAHTDAALAHAEAALLMDLREAAQVIYEAVWADPSHAEPSRTYKNAA
ncbi:MAG: hypothetical protein DMG87_15110, partial [Acidobacteria bacterium]